MGSKNKTCSEIILKWSRMEKKLSLELGPSEKFKSKIDRFE